MDGQEYSSGEYLAQQFRNYLQDAGQKKPGIGFVGVKSKHRDGNWVDLSVSGLEVSVEFNSGEDGERVGIHTLGAGGEPVVIKERIVVKRSREGRVSGSYFPDFFKEKILPCLRKKK